MKKLTRFVFALSASMALGSCGGSDVGTKMSSLSEGVPAEKQRVSGITMIMEPRLEDVTEDGFNIRYIEVGFGSGTPKNVRDLAISQCAKSDKKAMHKGNSRGLIQLNTVKAYYSCSS